MKLPLGLCISFSLIPDSGGSVRDGAATYLSRKYSLNRVILTMTPSLILPLEGAGEVGVSTVH